MTTTTEASAGQKGAALSALRHAYANRLDAARKHAADGGRVAGIFGHGAPSELLMACGYTPFSFSVALGEPVGPALRYYEPDIEADIFSGLNLLLKGEASFADLAIMVSRHKQDALLYHSSKEVLRRGEGEMFPPLHLYVILGDQIDAARDYSALQMRALAGRLKAGTGIAPTAASIGEAAKTANAIRAAGRKLLAERNAGRVSGVEAMEVIGAGRFMAPADYLKALNAYLAEPKIAPARAPRTLLVSGVPLHDTKLHQALEAGGLLVAAEDDAFGARAFSPDLVLSGDPLDALADHYSRHNPTRAVFPHSLRWSWFYEEAARADIDAVVFHVPLNQDGLGWDYPRLKEVVEAAGKPMLLVRQDPGDAEGARALTADAAAFVASLGSIQA